LKREARLLGHTKQEPRAAVCSARLKPSNGSVPEPRINPILELGMESEAENAYGKNSDYNYCPHIFLLNHLGSFLTSVLAATDG
jgi:hypothetical protein